MLVRKMGNRCLASIVTVSAVFATFASMGAKPAQAFILNRDDSGYVSSISDLEVGDDIFDVVFHRGSYNQLVSEGVTFEFSLANLDVAEAIIEALGEDEKIKQLNPNLISDGFFIPTGYHETDSRKLLALADHGLLDQDEAHEWDPWHFHRFSGHNLAELIKQDAQEVPEASMVPAVMGVAAVLLAKRKLAQSKNA